MPPGIDHRHVAQLHRRRARGVVQERPAGVQSLVNSRHEQGILTGRSEKACILRSFEWRLAGAARPRTRRKQARVAGGTRPYRVEINGQGPTQDLVAGRGCVCCWACSWRCSACRSPAERQPPRALPAGTADPADRRRPSRDAHRRWRPTSRSSPARRPACGPTTAPFPGPRSGAPTGKPTHLHFLNSLPASVGSLTLHNHGNHSSPHDDGQPMHFLVEFRAQSRTYHYTGLENGRNERGAMQWYHDHRDAVTGRNVWMGLAGMYIIDDPDDPPRRCRRASSTFRWPSPTARSRLTTSSRTRSPAPGCWATTPSSTGYRSPTSRSPTASTACGS